MIYDANKTGGPVPQTSLYGGPHLSAASYDLLLEANTLYAATSTVDGPALEIYDTSTIPANRLGEYLFNDDTQGGFSVQAASHYAYFGMSRNIGVVDVTQPSSPALVGTVPTAAIGSLAQTNNTLYAGAGNNTLLVINITNPAQPNIVRTISLPDLPMRVRVNGNLLLVADNASGLLIYDISSPQSPVLLSAMKSFVLAEDVAVQGTTAYVAADSDGLAIIDISNPAQPKLLSKTQLKRTDPFYLTPLNEAFTVALEGSVAYVGTVNDNALVFGLDCSNLAAPRIVSVFAYGDALDSWSGTLLFSGTELFVGGAPNGGVYPVTQVDMTQPFDSINQYFPPPGLQAPTVSRPNSLAGVQTRFGSNKPPRVQVENRFHGSKH